jgi:hypothetical protein
MNLPVARCPLTLPSPPVGERVAEGRVRGWFECTMGGLFPGILSLVRCWAESYLAPAGSGVPASCGG